MWLSEGRRAYGDGVRNAVMALLCNFIDPMSCSEQARNTLIIRLCLGANVGYAPSDSNARVTLDRMFAGVTSHRRKRKRR